MVVDNGWRQKQKNIQSYLDSTEVEKLLYQEREEISFNSFLDYIKAIIESF